MINRISFGQVYEDEGNRTFSMNTSWAGDDSSRITTIIYKDGPVYVVQMQGDKILNFSVDGRTIPMDGLGKYQAVIDTIKVRRQEAEVQAKRDRAQARLDRQQADKDRQQADRDREQAERDRQQSMKERDQAAQAREQEERNRMQDRLQVDRDRQQAEQDRRQADRDRQQADRDREQAEHDREQAQRDRVRAEEDRRMMDSLMMDLVADRIVPDRDSVHLLKMDANGVFVNGKRLPEAMEKKYITKYVKQGSSMSIERD